MNNAILNRFNLLNAVQRLSCASRYFSAGTATFTPPFIAFSLYYLYFPEFGILPASSSVLLSISTAMLAIDLLLPARFHDAIGRKPVMVTALLLASCCALLSTMMTSWHGIPDYARADRSVVKRCCRRVGNDTYLVKKSIPAHSRFLYGAL